MKVYREIQDLRTTYYLHIVRQIFGRRYGWIRRSDFVCIFCKETGLHRQSAYRYINLFIRLGKIKRYGDVLHTPARSRFVKGRYVKLRGQFKTFYEFKRAYLIAVAIIEEQRAKHVAKTSGGQWKGVTLEYLSNKLELSVSSINNAVRGNRRPNWEFLGEFSKLEANYIRGRKSGRYRYFNGKLYRLLSHSYFVT